MGDWIAWLVSGSNGCVRCRRLMDMMVQGSVDKDGDEVWAFRELQIC